MKEYYFNKIDSTQTYAKKLALENAENFVVYSDTQTSGTGRHGRPWEAPNGGLWFSFDVNSMDTDKFTLAIGVAVREVLENIYHYKVELKWPNDLILDDKKVGGILCEKVNNKIIVGIGINTNIQSINEKKAITFINATGISVNNKQLMNEIINSCKKRIQNHLNNTIEKFRANMAFKGKRCFVSAINMEAKIIDIDADGLLIVETDEGIKKIFTGEINTCI